MKGGGKMELFPDEKAIFDKIVEQGREEEFKDYNNQEKLEEEFNINSSSAYDIIAKINEEFFDVY